MVPSPSRRRLAARALAGALAALIVLGLVAAAGLAAEPAPGPAAAGLLPPPAPILGLEDAAKPYRIDLASRSDFVKQTNFVQCVGASVQMMLNILRPGADRTAATQRRLQQLARAPFSTLPGSQRLSGKYVLVVPSGAIRPGID
jgi:hypothetical protein